MSNFVFNFGIGNLIPFMKNLVMIRLVTYMNIFLVGLNKKYLMSNQQIKSFV